MMKKKEPSALGRLLSYAGSFRKLTYQSLLLSGLSSILSLMPFVYLWKIIKEVLEVQPDFSKATGIVHNGWMAVLFAVLSWLVYIAALVCSHGGAFRTASNMKKALMEHIARLPVGFADEMGSGRIRRTSRMSMMSFMPKEIISMKDYLIAEISLDRTRRAWTASRTSCTRRMWAPASSAAACSAVVPASASAASHPATRITMLLRERPTSRGVPNAWKVSRQANSR